MLKKVLKNKTALRVLFFACLFMTQPAFSASFTVKKVKGKQALIEFTGPQLENGKSYLINSSTDKNSGDERTHVFLLREVSLSSISSSVSSISGGKVTRLSLVFGYGWNFESFEISPLYGVKAIDAGNGSTSTSFLLGGLFDYNLTKNVVGTSSLWGASLESSYEKASGNGSLNSPATMSLFASGFWKWFVFSSTAGLRFDLGYLYQKTTTTFDNVDSGLSGRGSFAIYF